MLQSDRMVLRRIAWSDLDDVVELHNDPEVMHYLNNGAPVAREDVAVELGCWISSYSPAEKMTGFGFLAAVQADTHQFLGWFHLRGGDSVEDGLELGYRLRRSVWGRGLATEGSIALIDEAFARLPVERVYGQTLLVHDASRRVMEKSGLRLARVFPTEWPIRIPGDEHGDVEYELTRSSWKAARVALRCDA